MFHEILEYRKLFSAGGLDTTFGVGGIVKPTISVPTNPYLHATAVVDTVLLSTGKILAVSSLEELGANSYGLIRFNVDGSIDNTFGMNGLATFEAQGGYVVKLLLQNDGKIVVGGTTWGEPLVAHQQDFSVWRFNADGSVDTGFGNSGVAIVNPGAGGVYQADQLFDFAIDSQGRIVLGGSNYEFSNRDALARLTSNGFIDQSFGTQGIVLSDYGSGTGVKSIALDSGDQILTVGLGYVDGIHQDLQFAKYSVNGTPLSSFGKNGRLQDPTSNIDPEHMLVDPLSGNIYVIGISTFSQSANTSFTSTRLLKYTGSLARDTSFGVGGDVWVADGYSGADMAIDSSSAVTVGTTSSPTGSYSGNWTIARVLPTGSLDASFGQNGRTTFSFSTVSQFTSLLLQPDGKVVCGGSDYSQSAAFMQLLRLEGGATNVPITLGTATVSGKIFNDSNGNGILNSGEGALTYPNQPIFGTVLDGGSRIIARLSTATDSSGNYVFAHLPAGTLNLTVYATGNTQRVSTPNPITVALSNSSNISGINIGLTNTSSAYGIIYNDLNGNAKQDAGELGLQNRTVSATSISTAAVWSTVTAADGSYRIDGLPSGVFLRLASKTGWVTTQPTSSGSIQVNFFGAEVRKYDFGSRVDGPIANAGGPYQLAEGSTVALTGASSTTISGSISNYEWDLNYDGLVFEMDATGVSPVFSAVALDGPLTRTIALRVTNSLGQVSPIVTTLVTIQNVSPTATFGGTTSVDVSTNCTFGFTNISEPSIADTAAFLYSFDLNNDNDFTDAGEVLNGVSPSITCRFLTAGTYTIHGRIADKDGGFNDYRVPLTVNDISPLTGSISGIVYTDTNNNSLFDPGESFISGLNIWLDQNHNKVLDSGEQNVNSSTAGGFTFVGLVSGSYDLRAALNGNQVQTSPAGLINLTSGQNVASANIGIHTPVVATGASISGTAYSDPNKNGIRDTSESAISNITIWLDLDGDKIIDTSELTTVTDTQGNYEFTNVPSSGSSANTRVRAVIPTGSTQILPLNNFGYPVDLTAGISNIQKDFAIYTQPVTPVLASIAGVVYDDANNDGLMGISEAKLAGRTVFIDANNDNALNTGEVSVLSEANGAYYFGNLAAGSYKVMVVLSGNQHQTSAMSSISLIAGQIMTGFNIGINTPAVGTGASISGTAFNDTNKNGLRDAGEAGLPDITVWLDLDGDKIIDTSEVSKTTDAQGNYLFSNVAITGSSASTRLRAVIPTGKVQTLPSNGYGYPVDLRPGMTNTPRDFGIYTPTVTPPTLKGSITGFLFSDLNKNGIFDKSDTYQSGKTVFIDLDGDGVLDTNETKLTTDSKGAFKFANLNAGTFKIRRVLPTGYKLTTPARNIALTAGQNVTGVTIGSATV